MKLSLEFVEIKTKYNNDVVVVITNMNVHRWMKFSKFMIFNRDRSCEARHEAIKNKLNVSSRI